MIGLRQYSTLFRKEGASHSYDTLDFNIACIDSKIIVKTEGKELYSESYPDENGERVFVPSARKIRGADIEMSFCLRGEYDTANTDLFAFIKYLSGWDGSGVWFDFYDVYSHVARKHCRLKSIKEDKFFRNAHGNGYTTFKIVIRCTKNEQNGDLYEDFADVLDDYPKTTITPSQPESNIIFSRVSPAYYKSLNSIGMALISSHIIGGFDSKEVPNTDWADEDGDDSFALDKVYFEPYDIEYEIGYKGDEYTAAEKIRELYNEIASVGLLNVFDASSGVTYNGVNAVSYEQEVAHRDITEGNLVESVGLLVLNALGGYDEFITSDDKVFAQGLKSDGDIVVFKLVLRVTNPSL